MRIVGDSQAKGDEASALPSFPPKARVSPHSRGREGGGPREGQRESGQGLIGGAPQGPLRLPAAFPADYGTEMARRYAGQQGQAGMYLHLTGGASCLSR